MARTSSTILQSIISRIPRGIALGFRGGVIDTIFGAAADRLSDIEDSADALVLEADPRQAANLISDYERVLGPDPCGRDLDPLSLEQRQRIAHQRWTATGGQSIPYMISIAQKLGVDITIDEFWPSVAGLMQAGQPLLPEGIQFVWRINIPGLVTVVRFRAGASTAGNLLGTFEVSSIECELRRVSPAHTEPLFSYAEA